jgi:hypothetical protein
MPDQTVSTAWADDPAEPYSPDELAAVREIIETYNPAGSTQRRLLATIDQLLVERVEVGR